MWSDSENEGLLPLLHCHEGVLASSMYLVYLSFKVSMYQCQRNLSYNPYLHTSSTMELMCLEMFFNNNTNSKKLKLKILFIEYFLHTYCCVKHVTWIVSLNLYNNPMRQLLLLSLFYDEEMEAPSNLPKFTKLWSGWDKFSSLSPSIYAYHFLLLTNGLTMPAGMCAVVLCPVDTEEDKISRFILSMTESMTLTSLTWYSTQLKELSTALGVSEHLEAIKALHLGWRLLGWERTEFRRPQCLLVWNSQIRFTE